MRAHWTEDADRVSYDNRWLLGEDEYGVLVVPSLTRPGVWDRDFRWWRPTHWPSWLLSRRSNRLAWVESA